MGRWGGLKELSALANFKHAAKRYGVLTATAVALIVAGCSSDTETVETEPTATVEAEPDEFIVPEYDYAPWPAPPTATPWPEGIVPFTRHSVPPQDIAEEIEIWAEPSFGPFQFSERDLQFTSGDPVTLDFRTRYEYHTFTVNGLAIDEVISPGQHNRFTYTFHEPGTFTFYCIPHPYMTGTITVAEPVAQQ